MSVQNLLFGNTTIAGIFFGSFLLCVFVVIKPLQKSFFALLIYYLICLAMLLFYLKSRSGVIGFVAGAVEIVEFPVFSVIKSALVLSTDTEQEKRKAAKAALHRILFVRSSNKEITPLLVTIVPTPTYAASKGYDISSNTVNNLESGFSGWIFVRNWKEELKVHGNTNQEKCFANCV